MRHPRGVTVQELHGLPVHERGKFCVTAAVRRRRAPDRLPHLSQHLAHVVLPPLHVVDHVAAQLDVHSALHAGEQYDRSDSYNLRHGR